MSQAKTISTDEFNRLLLRLGRSRNAVRNQTMIYITHWSGMRVGEIASLKIKDVINKDGSIKSEVHLAASQTKGNSSRSVMVPKKLQDCWRRLNLDSECRFFLDRGLAANIWLVGC